MRQHVPSFILYGFQKEASLGHRACLGPSSVTTKYHVIAPDMKLCDFTLTGVSVY